MKSIITGIAMMIAVSASAQLAVSISPGLNLNGAYAGYKIADRFVVYGGMRFMHAQYKYSSEGQDYSGVIPGQIVDASYEDEYSLNLFLPTVGMKTFLISKNKLKSFVNISTSKPFLSGKYVEDGDVDHDFARELKRIKLFAAETSFGMEYFFDENFSLGGEFGIRLMRQKTVRKQDVTVYDPLSGASMITERTYTYSAMFNPTFSRISLNFYF